MSSPACERAIEESLEHGNALLKFLSRNDAGATNSHQTGFYLPKPAWQMYTPHTPTIGRNDKHSVQITWQDGRVTESVVTWYGAKKSEYRLTRFGKDFPFLNEDMVGDLFVLIPRTLTDFRAYILNSDDDIEAVQTTLGVQAFGDWGIYENNSPVLRESEDDCIERTIRELSATLSSFPTGDVFSHSTRTMLSSCRRKFGSLSLDDSLVECYESEYRLFQSVERIVCQNDVSGRTFRDIDDFLHTAASIMNRRKSRAGRSLENHVDHLLSQAGIPHVMRPALGADGSPDIVIPSVTAYSDPSWPKEQLFVVGVKTTCKDRWRQVLNEARRVPRKFILTLQQGISRTQIDEMTQANVSLVVPKRLQSEYPEDRRGLLLSIEEFVARVRERLSIET